MKLFRLVLLLAFTSACGFANAQSGSFTLKEVRYDKGLVYLFPNGSLSNPKECDSASPIALREGDPGFEQMYSMALSALVSGNPLRCWPKDCVVSSWGGTTRPRMYACGLLAK